MNIFMKLTGKSLAKNKTRTSVTGIGIILSVTLICAVITLLTSLLTSLYNFTLETEGNFHVAVNNMSDEQRKALAANADIGAIGSVNEIGYAVLNDNPEKPYIYISAFNASAFELLPIHLLQGRLPENEWELAIPEHMNGYKIGDIITLDIGERMANGVKLDQYAAYNSDEEIMVDSTKTYTIAGVIAQVDILERNFSLGYGALTFGESAAGATSETLYLTMKNPKDIYSFAEMHLSSLNHHFNATLLSCLGASQNESMTSMLIWLAAILILMIVAGSATLIHNSFAISVADRTKQMGLLLSLGASQSQIRNMVFFEALFLGVASIPIGITFGIFGTGGLLKVLGGFVAKMMFSDITLTLDISFIVIIAVAALSAFTIFISAIIPAKRASAVAIIDTIRQAKDIKINKSKRQVKSVFGLEGILAKKNFKRNSRQYRAAVVSIAMSAILFISVGSFCAYSSRYVEVSLDEIGYDLRLRPTIEQTFGDDKELFRTLSAIKGIENAGWSAVRNIDILADKNLFTEAYINKADVKDDFVVSSISVITIDNDRFYRFVSDMNMELPSYTNTNAPLFVASGKTTLYDNDGNSHEGDIFTRSEGLQIAARSMSEEAAMRYRTDFEKDPYAGLLPYDYYDIQFDIPIGAVVDEFPMEASHYTKSHICILIPESMSGLFSESGMDGMEMYFKAANSKAVLDDIHEILDSKEFTSGVNIYDVSEAYESQRNMATVIQIFNYVFIAIMSLITIANVFNTTTTNIQLRRREFAMFRSIGMTNGSVKAMVSIESLLYGVKALFYSLLISAVMIVLIHKGIAIGTDMAFFLPVQEILIASVSVIVTLFITMLYSLSRIAKDNIVETIKNENI